MSSDVLCLSLLLHSSSDVDFFYYVDKNDHTCTLKQNRKEEGSFKGRTRPSLLESSIDDIVNQITEEVKPICAKVQ